MKCMSQHVRQRIWGRGRRWALLVASVVALGALSSPAGANTTVSFSRPTLTAGPRGGDSAVVLQIKNTSSTPISILSITSPDATSSMIGFDTNMCNGDSLMTPLTNVLIPGANAQLFGYRNQGAMLSGLKTSLTASSSVTLVVRWSDFQQAHTTVLHARVVTPPKGLTFKMARMRM